MKEHLGLIEMLFIFGCGIGFVLWELYSLRRSSRDEDSERATKTKRD